MLSLTLLVLAVFAGLLGFGGIFGASTPIAWIFVGLLVSTAVVVVAPAVRGSSPRRP